MRGSGISAGLFVIGLVGTVIRRSGGPAPNRQRRSRQRGTPARRPTTNRGHPLRQGVKIEQLKTLAALRDSGALTEKEFQAEKRRVLDGG